MSEYQSPIDHALQSTGPGDYGVYSTEQDHFYTEELSEHYHSSHQEHPGNIQAAESSFGMYSMSDSPNAMSGTQDANNSRSSISSRNPNTQHRSIPGKVFIGGLNPMTNEKTLNDHFSKWGAIHSVRVNYDRVTKASKGFAFVTFEDRGCIDPCINERHVIDGSKVTVDRAQARDHDGSIPEYRTAEIFLGGLPYETSEDVLREHFNKYGPITNIRRKGGYAFVVFEHFDYVDHMLASEPNEHVIVGRKITVARAKPKGMSASTSINTGIAPRAPPMVGMMPRPGQYPGLPPPPRSSGYRPPLPAARLPAPQHVPMPTAAAQRGGRGPPRPRPQYSARPPAAAGGYMPARSVPSPAPSGNGGYVPARSDFLLAEHPYASQPPTVPMYYQQPIHDYQQQPQYIQEPVSQSQYTGLRGNDYAFAGDHGNYQASAGSQAQYGQQGQPNLYGGQQTAQRNYSQRPPGQQYSGPGPQYSQSTGHRYAPY